MAKAVQFLSSRDELVAMIVKYRLTLAVGHINSKPHTEFLSGSKTHGLYAYTVYSKGADP